MITRRTFVRGASTFVAGSLGLGGYAFGVEPLLRLAVTRYQVSPSGWPAGLRLNICALADIHAAEPGMSPERIRQIAETANALQPDIVVLLGDYVRGHHYGWSVPADEWSGALKTLRAPLGVHAILGNHDWWDDKIAQREGGGPVIAQRALESVGIPVHHNQAIRLQKDGHSFWLAGLGDQIALIRRSDTGRRSFVGLDDLDGTLKQVTDNSPVILLAHEPDIFATVPGRVALTLSGHTHGGQLRIMGYSPIVPSRYGNRYAYGHVRENDSDLIISGGLGCSIMPMRFGVPPEIVMVELA